MFEIPKNSKVLKVLLPVLIIFFALMFLPTIISGIKTDPLDFGIGLVIILSLYIFAKMTKPGQSLQAEIPVRPTIDNSTALVMLNVVSGISLLMIGIFLGVGWEVFLFGPFVAICFIVFMIVITKSFRTYNASNLTIYTMLVLLILSMLSIKLNSGIVTDGPELSYFMEFLLGVNGGNVNAALFAHLLKWSAIFFLVATLFINQMSHYRGGIKKSQSVFIIIIALAFPVIHIGYFLYHLPEFRIVQARQAEIEKKKEDSLQDSRYATSSENAYSTSFTNRIYSVIKVAEITTKHDNSCDYIQNYFESLADSPISQSKGFNITCYKKDILSQLGSLPYSTTTGMGIDIPFSDLKKGDIIAVTVKMSPESYLGLRLPGNNNKNMGAGLRKIEKFNGIDAMQFPIQRETQTITVFYPVNVPFNTNSFSIDIGKLSETGNPFDVTLLEVGKISYDSYSEPEWFNK